jgi:Icc-related predicted phosphoesterase
MKIGILSDLHLSRDPFRLEAWPWDVLVLAGDLGRAARAMAWAREAPCPTVLVAGNHEYYGSDLATTVRTLKELAAGSKVTVLERESVLIGGIRFLGSTLWSDFRPIPDGQDFHANTALITQAIRDFSSIRVSSDSPDMITPALCRAVFDQTVDWLEQEFLSEPTVPTVVVSHFAPSARSIHPSFHGSPLNAAFVSELGDRIARWRPELWIHGHTHNSFDYDIGHTRVVCNPGGYAFDGNVENPGFNPGLTINVSSAVLT